MGHVGSLLISCSVDGLVVIHVASVEGIQDTWGWVWWHGCVWLIRHSVVDVLLVEGLMSDINWLMNSSLVMWVFVMSGLMMCLWVNLILEVERILLLLSLLGLLNLMVLWSHEVHLVILLLIHVLGLEVIGWLVGGCWLHVWSSSVRLDIMSGLLEVLGGLLCGVIKLHWLVLLGWRLFLHWDLVSLLFLNSFVLISKEALDWDNLLGGWTVLAGFLWEGQNALLSLDWLSWTKSLALLLPESLLGILLGDLLLLRDLNRLVGLEESVHLVV